MSIGMLPSRGALKALGWYQKKISPKLAERGVHCRYEPTCSHYMALAIEKHGLIVGVRKGVARLMDCRPYGDRSFVDYP